MPIRGGVKTLYPEYRAVLNKTATVDSLTVPSSRSANDVAKRIADQSPKDGQVHVLPVQGNIYMLVADGTNITASVGKDGIAVVNTGSAQMSEKILAALDQLAKAAAAQPAPNTCFGAELSRRVGLVQPVLQYVHRLPASGQIDALRHQHERGAGPHRRQREACHLGLRPARRRLRLRRRLPDLGAESVDRRPRKRARPDERARRQGDSGARTTAWPTETYFDEFHKLSEYVNGEAVILYHAPAANTDGDSFVFFRHSEVISAGNLFSTVSYPLIDVARAAAFRA